MGRKALIIGNPGKLGEPNYCDGVEKDLENYRSFLRSPVGGLWYDNEITVLLQPDAARTRAEIVAQVAADYSMTIFCGHGHYSTQSRSTIVELKPGVDLDSNELRRGADRHTLILDCCRAVALAKRLVESLMAKAMKAEPVIHPSDCRKYFDQRLMLCPTGLVVLHACSVGETAGDSGTQGGYYSYSLLDGAVQWVRDTYVDTSRNTEFFSIVEAHEAAKRGVDTLSGGRQTPQIEKPRTSEYFPFAIIS